MCVVGRSTTTSLVLNTERCSTISATPQPSTVELQQHSSAAYGLTSRITENGLCFQDKGKIEKKAK